MKKIFALLTVISMIALVFCSCGKKEVIVDTDGDVSSTSSSQNNDKETVNSYGTVSDNSGTASSNKSNSSTSSKNQSSSKVQTGNTQDSNTGKVDGEIDAGDIFGDSSTTNGGSQSGNSSQSGGGNQSGNSSQSSGKVDLNDPDSYTKVEF